MDTLRDVDKLAVYTRGQNWTLKNCDRLGNLIKNAGERLGLKISDASFYPGGTDADAFTRHGFSACGVCAIDHNFCNYYHTRDDNPDNLSEECLQKSLELCITTARLFDETGLASNS